MAYLGHLRHVLSKVCIHDGMAETYPVIIPIINIHICLFMLNNYVSRLLCTGSAYDKIGYVTIGTIGTTANGTNCDHRNLNVFRQAMVHFTELSLSHAPIAPLVESLASMVF